MDLYKFSFYKWLQEGRFYNNISCSQMVMEERGWDLSISPGPLKPSASLLTAKKSWGKGIGMESLAFYPAKRIESQLEPGFMQPD